MPKGKCLQVWPVWACRISHLLRLQQEGYRLSSPHHRSSRHPSFRLCEELEEVRILKDCGNLKLKDKDYQEAEKLYNQAILKLEEYREKVPAAQKGNMVFLESTTLLNLAKIKAEANDYTSLLNLSKSVVLISPDSGKGYYRYAEALYHLQKYGAALEKIKLAKKYATFDEST
jgi:tetratricopeptide (TPR) repeat protein